MKCDELKSYTCGGWCCDKEAYPKKDVDEAIAELKARIHELEITTRTDNSAVIGLLSDELEKLRPMEAALEIAEADNKKYIERIKELEAENKRLKATPEQIMKETFDKVLIYPKELVSLDDAYKLAVETKEAKHALWLARVKRAIDKIAWFKLWNASISTMNPKDGARQEYEKWKKALGKFLKKAEEYK